MKWTELQLCSVGLLATVALTATRRCLADMPPNPNPYRRKNKDGSNTPLLKLQGGGRYAYETDVGDFSIVEQPDGTLVYGHVNSDSGKIEPSACRVGKSNPAKCKVGNEPLHKNEKPSKEEIDRLCGDACHQPEPRLNSILEAKKIEHQKNLLLHGNDGRHLQEAPAHMKNLVVNIRFSDHGGRQMPSLYALDKLFNSVGGHSTYAPTGSVYDVFAFNSYNQFELESIVTPFYTVSQTEKYYADGNHAFTGKFSQAIKEALNALDRDPTIKFSDFDQDNDGFIDAITILHSGYGAEWGGTDQYGQGYQDRIWSHQWSLSGGVWTSSDGVKVSSYHVSPALWWTQGNEIGRIGVIAHETGHFLGLPDLYDGTGGTGIGSYGLMGNSWGFSGDQWHCPMLSPWAKIRLGWVDPIVIEDSGTYTIEESHSSKHGIYMIEAGYGPGEYLLIENRQPHRHDDVYQFEKKVPQGGLVIWHIDDNANDIEEGHPGQPGWPGNGNHYRVAVLQADGQYELEKGSDRGDGTDVFHGGGGVAEIGPDGVASGPYPNTDSYMGYKTNYRIHSISPSASSMTFSFDNGTTGPSPTRVPTNVPTRRPTLRPNSPWKSPTRRPSPRPTLRPTPAPTKSPLPEGLIPIYQLQTTMTAGTGQAGNMFDVYAKNVITIKSMDLHCDTTNTVHVKVYTKLGSYSGYEKNPGEWDLISETDLQGMGRGKKTPIPSEVFNAVDMNSGTTRAFYVTFMTNNMEYSRMRGVQEGDVFVQNSDIAIMVGKGNKYEFRRSYKPRIWNGVLKYEQKAPDAVGPGDTIYPLSGSLAFPGVVDEPKDELSGVVMDDEGDDEDDVRCGTTGDFCSSDCCDGHKCIKTSVMEIGVCIRDKSL